MAIFEEADTNQNGFAEFTSFVKVLTQLNPTITHAQVEELTQCCIGECGDGRPLNYKDFASVIGAYNAWAIAGETIREALASGHRTLFSKRLLEVKDIFEAMDKKAGGSGDVTLEAFKDGMKRLSVPLSDAQFVQVYHSIDVDGSGVISIEEFIEALATPPNEADESYKIEALIRLHGLSKEGLTASVNEYFKEAVAKGLSDPLCEAWSGLLQGVLPKVSSSHVCLKHQNEGAPGALEVEVKVITGCREAEAGEAARHNLGLYLVDETDAGFKAVLNALVRGRVIGDNSFNVTKVDLSKSVEVRGPSPEELKRAAAYKTLQLRSIFRLFSKWNPNQQLFQHTPDALRLEFDSRRTETSSQLKSDLGSELGSHSDLSVNEFRSALRVLDPEMKEEQVTDIFKALGWEMRTSVDDERFTALLLAFNRYCTSLSRIIPKVLGEDVKSQLLSTSVLKVSGLTHAPQ